MCQDCLGYGFACDVEGDGACTSCDGTCPCDGGCMVCGGPS